MEGKLPLGEGSETLAEMDRPAGTSAPARKEAAPGRREMNVAVLKTKAEQALTETFAAIADRLPGGAEVRKARIAADFPTACRFWP
jgi:hypothetical protein